MPAHTPPGVMPITARCDVATGRVKYPPAQVIVDPSRDPAVTLSTSRVTAGGSLTVRAVGFFADEHLSVMLRGVAVLAVVTADGAGAASTAVRLPIDAPVGGADIDVTGRISKRTATAGLTVLAAPGQCGTTSCEPPPAMPPLADTGVSAGEQALVGAGLLALGVLFLAAGRRYFR